MSLLQKEKIFAELMVDKYKNCSLIGFIKQNDIDYLTKIGESYLLRGKSDRPWIYVSITNEQDIPLIIENLTQYDTNFAAVGETFKKAVLNNEKAAWELYCYKYVFCDETELQAPEKGYQTRSLASEDAEYIYSQYDYGHYSNVNYIRERIEKGIAVGVEINGKLAAWLLTHDDGAMGMLKVLEPYRNKGLAYYLTISMIQKLRESGEVPFVFIEVANEKSWKLAEKIGFTKMGLTYWFKK